MDRGFDEYGNYGEQNHPVDAQRGAGRGHSAMMRISGTERAEGKDGHSAGSTAPLRGICKNAKGGDGRNE